MTDKSYQRCVYNLRMQRLENGLIPQISGLIEHTGNADKPYRVFEKAKGGWTWCTHENLIKSKILSEMRIDLIEQRIKLQKQIEIIENSLEILKR